MSNDNLTPLTNLWSKEATLPEQSDPNNKESQFNALYMESYESLCLYATHYLAIEEAKEVVQDTMLWLWDNWDTIVPEKSVKSLLFRIVHNKAVNCIKHKSVLTRVHEQIARNLSQLFESPDFYFATELRQMYEDALNRLPEPLREVFHLSRVEQLSYKEIAERLGVTTKVVDNRLARTMRILRKELDEYL